MQASTCRATLCLTVTPAGAVVALWLLVPPDHDLTAALQLSCTFLQAQRATTPESLPGFVGVLPPNSALNLKDTALTASALQQYPWLELGPTDNPLDAVKVNTLSHKSLPYVTRWQAFMLSKLQSSARCRLV